jgi:hypothetical protein
MSDILIARIKKRIQIPEKATDMGKYGLKAHIYPCATLVAIEAAETAMGFRMPDLLRRLYLEIGNGGFGPGYGLVGVEGGMETIIPPYDYHTLPDIYFDIHGRPVKEALEMLGEPHDEASVQALLENAGEPPDDVVSWPDKMLPICNWGCWIISGIDCSEPQGPVWTLNGQCDELLPECPSFETWMEAWLNDEDLLRSLH